MKKCLYRTIGLSLAIVFLCFNFSACTRAGTSTSENSGVLSTTFSDNEIELGEVPINNLNEEDDNVLQGLNKNYNLYGYDVLNSSYINAREVKSKAILDEAKYDASKYKEISDDLKGSDIDDYYVEKMSNIYSQINVLAGVDYKNAVFSGNVQAEYGTKEQTSSKQIFMTYMEKHILSGVEFTGTTKDLTEMLSKEFLNDVKNVDKNSMTAAKLFKDYGTHLIVEYYTGGRVRLNFAYTNESGLKESELKAKAKATYNAVTTKVDSSKKESAEEFATIANMHFQSFGGDSITGRTVDGISDQMKDWTKSVPEKQTICGIGDFDRSLIPIWELLDDAEYHSVKQKIEKEFVEQSKRKSLFLGELDFLDENKAYISDIIVVDGSTVEGAKKLVPKGYKYVYLNFDGEEILDANKGLKHYILIAYQTTKFRNGAITDIKVDLGENTTHKGYTKIDEDLNKKVGGKYVYLYYKKATMDEAVNPETKFIHEIRGQYNKINSLPAGWSQPSTTKDLNSGANGKFIYLMIRKS
ncbi:MAC/perforin domain-containing protein [Alkalibaculum bacchi]|uniref:MAC/perforin domain-containing protein n=1 Tax=Alkalibaculum bacchi TaxID=645887 RepID=UPI0026EC100E|nr:MAC/perforin domain-containing protein [Alkalibaculum bacchi]